MDQRGIEVPSYDGAPEGLAAYKEAVLQYLMATETHKRYLVGPRLVETDWRCQSADSDPDP